jgi:hypothetical protein
MHKNEAPGSGLAGRFAFRLLPLHFPEHVLQLGFLIIFLFPH